MVKLLKLFRWESLISKEPVKYIIEVESKFFFSTISNFLKHAFKRCSCVKRWCCYRVFNDLNLKFLRGLVTSNSQLCPDGLSCEFLVNALWMFYLFCKYESVNFTISCTWTKSINNKPSLHMSHYYCKLFLKSASKMQPAPHSFRYTFIIFFLAK